LPLFIALSAGQKAFGSGGQNLLSLRVKNVPHQHSSKVRLIHLMGCA